MAIVRMRRTASARTALALVRGCAAGLQPQQRRDRLEVVLHPVVDLADGGVLRQEQPVPLPQLAHVPQQQHPAGDGTTGHDRDAAGEQRDLGGLVDLFDHRLAALEGLPHGGVVEAQLGQALADGVGVDADPVQRGHRVRRRVLHARRRRRRTITPSPTRGATGALLRRASNGKLPSAIIAANRWKMDR